MNLLRVELRRLRARRLGLVLLIATVAVMGLATAATAWESRPITAAERAEAERIVADEAEVFDVEAERASCEEAQAEERERSGDSSIDFGCQDISALTVEDLLRSPFDFAVAAPDAVLSAGFGLALAAFVLGAGFVGAEWSAGTLGTLLLFEPRRPRVMSTKAAAVGLTVSVVAAALIVVLLLALYANAAVQGVTDGIDGRFVGSLALAVLRAAALCAAAALVGFGLAGTLRHTSAALGIAFGYAALGEVALRGSLPASEPWLASNQVVAWLQGGYEVPIFDCPPSGECTTRTEFISLLDSALYLGLVTALVLAICLLTFRRRDLT